jgi:hypothetical protein
VITTSVSWPRHIPFWFRALVAGLIALAAKAQPITDIGEFTRDAGAIRSLVAQGIITAPRGLFRPSAPLTAAEFAQSMQKMFALKPPSVAKNFPDVPSTSPLYSAVEAVTPYLGRQILCPGCDLAATFSPEAPVSGLGVAVATLNVLLAINKIELLKPEQAEAILRDVPASARLRGPLLRSYAATAINAGILTRADIDPGNRPPVLPRARAASMLDLVQTKFGFTKIRPGQ